MNRNGRFSTRDRRLGSLIFSLLALAAFTAPAMAGTTSNVWQNVPGKPSEMRVSSVRAVSPARSYAYTLNHDGMRSLLAGAPLERSRAANESPLVLELPAPNGTFQRFKLAESPIMEAGLAAKHPEIKTYSGRGIDDRTATIRADLTPLGFHASVRSAHGAWYIDPYYHRDTSLYVTYYGRDLTENPHGTFVETEPTTAGVSTDKGYYHAADPVTLHGTGFAENAPITITISDPNGVFGPRTVLTMADATGSFDATFDADPNGVLGPHQVDATDGSSSATALYDVVTDEDVSHDPPVGDVLRTYRLALVTDPSYSTYFGGPAFVTAAKVTLMNRVDQIYEDETSVRMVLVANNDLLNLDTAALMTGANGPCGSAACYTAGQASTCSGGTLTRTRIVIGQIIGASNYDIGHIGFGLNGGGVASLGVVGGNNKAQGCTGLPFPVGDFFAVDYVAHEMGHQYAGNHSFNGTISNCSGGNRSGANSVEPGSGSSIMAYAGICGTDNLQPHSDPYWSQRSFQEIATFTTNVPININEVQTVSLRDFGANGDSFTLNYNGNDSIPIVRGTNYTTAAIAAAIAGIPGWPGGTVAVVAWGGSGALNDSGFQVTFNTAPLTLTNVSALGLTNLNLCSGFVGETAKGGQNTNRGFTVTATGNSFPIVTAPASFTIPLRTPFTLTGSATDADGDTLTYLWEQNDRGGATGTALLNNTKVNGPLFRQFGSASNPPDPLQYNTPLNFVTTDPTRVFPSLGQILSNNTNAETGTCANNECFSEFLPTSSYVGFAPINASPLSLHMRLTVRDGNPGGGGVNVGDTTLLLATGTGPFLVTYPNTAVVLLAGSGQTVTWNVAGTSAPPISAANVRISLSTDGGLTFPTVLAASTPNDGSEPVTLPIVATIHARVKVEAVGNIFFDISNSDFTITVLISGPVTGKVWLGLKNSDDVGTRFDVKAEVLKNGTVVGTGQIDNVPGGSSGFNNAILRTIDIALSSSPVPIAPGDILGFRLSARIGATGHRSGTARLWFDDAQANSRLEAVFSGTPATYYLRDGFVLGATSAPVTKTSKKTIDVFGDRLGGNPFKAFGTWTKTF